MAEGICKRCGARYYESYPGAREIDLCDSCEDEPAETGTVPDKLPGIAYAAGPAPYVQRYGRGKRKHGGKMANMLVQSMNSPPHVVDYAGSKTARLNPAQPDKLCEDEGCPQHGTPHVCVDPSLVEQLARRLETFADDNDAMVARRRLTITDAREMRSAAHTFRSSAKELREAMTAQNKALYQVEINTILERFGVSETVKDDISLAIVKEFMG